MKKALILFVVSTMFVGMSYISVNAQETNEAATNAPTFGIKGGINISNLSTKEADQDKMLTGFNLGVFAKMPITNDIAIQPELYYTTKGAQVNYNSTFVDGTAKFNLNYIEMPLLLIVNLTDNFNIHFGPYVSYLIDGKVTNESTSSAFNFEDNIKTEDYNKFEAGIAAGAGVDIGAISLGARYTYGLTKVGKERTFLGTSYTFPDAKNGVASIYVAFSLGQH
jgi:hypothetical protein